MSKILQERWLRLAGITHQDRGSAPINEVVGSESEGEDLSMELDQEILGLNSEDIWNAGLEGQLEEGATGEEDEA